LRGVVKPEDEVLIEDVNCFGRIDEWHLDLGLILTSVKMGYRSDNIGKIAITKVGEQGNAGDQPAYPS
jgi:hypothetical protein